MTTPYWLDPTPNLHGALEGNVECDIVVIGGGLCGTSAALHLAEMGVRVVLLEGRHLAESASGRNAGFILQGTAERYSRAVSLMGRERARKIHAWTVENHERMAACIRQHEIDCAYQKRGSLQLAGSKEEEVELLESAALLNEDGFAANERAGKDLPFALQNAGFEIGVHLPGDGELDPARLVRGIARAAATQGASIHEQSRVVDLDASEVGDVRVRTSDGEIRAAVAVVATNARAGELLPWFSDKVDPVRGQMLATEPCPPLFDCPIYANHGYDYWRQDEKGCVVLGGWRNLDPQAEVGHQEVVNMDIQSHMEEFLTRVGVDAPITHRWAGIMGFSRDGLPLVGPAPGAAGAVVGTGFTGHGYGFAFLAGAALAQVAVEGTHPFCTDLDPRRLS
ncbi:MAG: FAD-binding oxidoreductase [Myxococcota bacterium]|nr:FAD-binding oxidoreductase [Myxococcota bacterium]